MPSFPHEIPLEMCRWRGDLAHELLRGRAQLPEGELIDRHASGDFSQIAPIEFRADHVVTFHRSGERGVEKDPVLVVIIESQIDKYEPKKFSWPAYVGVAHSTWKCDVVLLVLTKSDLVTTWAKGPFGPHQMQLHPVVVNLSELPHELSEADALRMPELAVLIAIGHCTEETAKVAFDAIKQLPKEKAELCFDAIMHELPEAVRNALKEEQAMIEDYEFRSEIALRQFARVRKEAADIAKKEGLEEGKLEAKREILATFQQVALDLMKSKLTRIPAAQRTAVRALVDESALASLISELGRAADAAQARTVVKRALAA